MDPRRGNHICQLLLHFDRDCTREPLQGLPHSTVICVQGRERPRLLIYEEVKEGPFLFESSFRHLLLTWRTN